MIRFLLLSTALARVAFFDNDAPTLVIDDATKAPVLRDGKLVFKTKAGAEELADPMEIYTGRARITALNGESMNHRKSYTDTAEKLKAFEGIDPVKAREAFETLSKIDQKKLIDAGQVDQVKGEIEKVYKGQIDTLSGENGTLKSRLNKMILTNALGSSKFATTRLNIPLDIVEATFGRHFSVDDEGRISAKDANGQPIFSTVNIGQHADLNEALEKLVAAYPNRDQILKGANQSGTGNSGNGHDASKKTYSRAEFVALKPMDQARVAREIREGKVNPITD